MNNKIIGTIIVATILGSVLGFSISYVIFQPQLDELQKNIVLTFEDEVEYYTNLFGTMIDTDVLFTGRTWTWAEIEQFWNETNYDPIIIQVSREELRNKVEIVIMTQGYCQIYWDRDVEIIWIWVLNTGFEFMNNKSSVGFMWTSQ